MKIAIIDKSPVFMEGLGYLLKSHFDISNLWSCISMDAFQNKFPETQPNLFILGMNKILHDNNLSIIALVKQYYPNANIVVISERSSLQITGDFLRTGAKGCLTYSNDTDEFLQCILKVMNGKMFVSNEMLFILLREKNTVVRKTPTSRLTNREKHVAGLLGSGKKAGEIAKSLGLKTATIFATKRIIFRKLKIETIVELRRAYEELLAGLVIVS